MYLSCPDCRKKVIEESDNKWKCEHCSKVHDSNLPTYMLSALISDVSGSVMVQFPRELGDPIMGGMSAPEFKQLKDDLKDQPEKLKSFFLNCAFKVRKVPVDFFSNTKSFSRSEAATRSIQWSMESSRSSLLPKYWPTQCKRRIECCLNDLPPTNEISTLCEFTPMDLNKS